MGLALSRRRVGGEVGRSSASASGMQATALPNAMWHLSLLPACDRSTQGSTTALSASWQVLAERIRTILRSADVLDLSQLCIDQGKAAWVAYLGKELHSMYVCA
jgi:hypothetical protein